ncbi:hypothetical protein [Chryseobacterium kwangjuense]|uniref:Uncharacterized protein n=1 Tax=Chryseobacterium kwangjuense TaxID=267125 RepID=A0A135WIS1_9FLAO|nr:hypothetical protein [Chryseobacterium kwangjuense]KXH84791.1 hypothetical protein AU378_03260 [Chryseobacterium kwangjuense]
MKKIICTVFLFSSVFFFSQKNQNYIQVSYSSICCGTPSTQPLMDYVKQFEKKNKLRPLEILRHSGLGREGEFNLYIGIDKLSKKKKTTFLKGLQFALSSQNEKRKKDRDGHVNLDSAETIHGSNLKDIKNLTIYKK